MTDDRAPRGDWLEGICSGCHHHTRVRHFATFGILCSDCFFKRSQDPMRAMFGRRKLLRGRQIGLFSVFALVFLAPAIILSGVLCLASIGDSGYASSSDMMAQHEYLLGVGFYATLFYMLSGTFGGLYWAARNGHWPY